MLLKNYNPLQELTAKNPLQFQTSTEVNTLNGVTQIGFITHVLCVICQHSWLNPMKPVLFILRWLTLAYSYTLHSQFCFRRALNQKCCKDSRNTHTRKCQCVTCHLTPPYTGDISGSKRFISFKNECKRVYLDPVTSFRFKLFWVLYGFFIVSNIFCVILAPELRSQNTQDKINSAHGLM